MPAEPCICWTGPVVLHEGHCCFRDVPDGWMEPVPPCGHQVVEVVSS